MKNTRSGYISAPTVHFLHFVDTHAYPNIKCASGKTEIICFLKWLLTPQINATTIYNVLTGQRTRLQN